MALTLPLPLPLPLTPTPQQVRGGTFVHLAVNAERLAALVRPGRLESGVRVRPEA